MKHHLLANRKVTVERNVPFGTLDTVPYNTDIIRRVESPNDDGGLYHHFFSVSSCFVCIYTARLIPLISASEAILGRLLSFFNDYSSSIFKVNDEYLRHSCNSIKGRILLETKPTRQVVPIYSEFRSIAR